MSIKEVAERLKESGTIGELKYKADLLTDDESGDTAISIKLEGREEFPILVVDFEETLICSAILFPQEEVDEALWTEFLEEILGLNVVIPQCSFALQDNMVSILRNMPDTASVEEIIDAVSVLTSVADDVMQDLVEYLIEDEEEEAAK